MLLSISSTSSSSESTSSTGVVIYSLIGVLIVSACGIGYIGDAFSGLFYNDTEILLK